MNGTRVEHIRDLWGDGGLDGGYCRTAGTRDGRPIWMVRTPNGHLGDLANHEVTEHEDGTISVLPSILVSGREGVLWHGYLTRGVWRSV